MVSWVDSRAGDVGCAPHSVRPGLWVGSFLHQISLLALHGRPRGAGLEGGAWSQERIREPQ